METTIINQLKKHADDRFSRYKLLTWKDIISADDFHLFPSDYYALILNNKSTVLNWFDEALSSQDKNKNLLNFFSNNFLSFLFHKNQYINKNNIDSIYVYKLYKDFLNNLKIVIINSSTHQILVNRLRDVMISHNQDLAKYVNHLANMECDKSFFFQEPVCSEYSPEFQLETLNISINDLIEPILDIGCGENGALVSFLRNKNINVTGIDRIAREDLGLLNADWLDYNFKKNYWGTIISHISFSNHFIYNHLNRFGQPEKYAILYKNILDALKINGSFIYTPGLPFIEPYISSNNFTIKKLSVSIPSSYINQDIFKQYQTYYFYTTKIKRIN